MLAAAASPPTYQVTYAGGDGSSLEQAVLIKGAPDDGAGVKAEYLWVRDHYPSLKFDSRGFLSKSGRSYDTLDGDLGGQRRTFYFDISEFYKQP